MIYALVESLIIEEDMVLGMVILQDISQRCNSLGRRPRVPLRTEHSRRKRWGGEQVIKFAMTSVFNCSHRE
jgi:hypothetical protein